MSHFNKELSDCLKKHTHEKMASKMITYLRKRKREIFHSSNANQTQLMGLNLLDLPSHVTAEILIRIPPRDVLHCRCVCKTLCKLISSPPFANNFLSKSPFVSAIHQSGNDIIFRRLLGYGEFTGSTRTLKQITTHSIPRMENVELVGCSNGLICFWHKSSSFGKSLYITNPVLGQFSLLPKPLSDKYASIKESYWFGYIPKSGCYKVVRFRIRKAVIQQSNPRKFFEKSEIHVLVVGSDSWNYVGDAPFPLYGKICVDVLDGCIHWLVDDDKNTLKLHSFNVEKDRASTFPAPPELGSKCYFFEIGVLGKYFSLIESDSKFEQFEIWSMKNHGVASSWTKECIFTIKAGDLELRPLPFHKDGEITIYSLGGRLLSHDTKDNKHGIITFGRAREPFRVYIPSLLSLTHVSKGKFFRVKNLKSFSLT